MTDHLMSRHSPPAWLSIRSQLPQPLGEFFPDTNIQESFHIQSRDCNTIRNCTKIVQKRAVSPSPTSRLRGMRIWTRKRDHPRYKTCPRAPLNPKCEGIGGRLERNCPHCTILVQCWSASRWLPLRGQASFAQLAIGSERVNASLNRLHVFPRFERKSGGTSVNGTPRSRRLEFLPNHELLKLRPHVVS